MDDYNARLAKELKLAKERGLLRGDYPPAGDAAAMKKQARQLAGDLADYLTGPDYQP